MSEQVRTYMMDDPEVLIPMDRKVFYEEQVKVHEKGGEPQRAVDVVAVLLFNPRGEILLQKRSYDKGHNPGLIDKSLGGHVQYGDTVNYTVMVETVQELQTPSIVLRSNEDFIKTHTLLKEYLATLAILKHVDTKIHEAQRIVNENNIKVLNRTHLYFGMYDGRVRPADGEAQGVLWYTLDELAKEMKNMPDLFTNDLHIFLKEYEKEITEFLKIVQGKE